MGTRNRHSFHFPVQKFDDRIGLWKNFRYLEDYLQQISNEHSSNMADIVVAPSDTREDRYADVILSGTADQTQLNTVFADALANDLWVHILSGTVNVTGAIDLDTTGDMKVTGAGIGMTTIVQFSGTPNGMIEGNAQGTTYWSDMTWDGNSNAQQCFNGGLADGHALNLFRIEVTGGTNAGINLNRTAALQILIDCFIHNNSGVGIAFGREDAGLVQGCEIHNNTGVGLQPGGTGNANSMRIIGNSIYDNAHGIKSSGGSHRSEDLLIVGNSIFSNTGNSIDVIGTDHVIVGNRFESNGTDAPVVLAGSLVMGNNIGGTPSFATHASLTGITIDDHHNEAHTVVSHSDTTGTGTELDTLTDGSDADSLHDHPIYLTLDGTRFMTGALDVDQPSTSGALPVITLDQADVDEDFFKFTGTSDTDVDRALVDAVNFTTPGTITGWLKVNIQDEQGTDPITDGDYYIPFYTAPTV